MDGDFNTKGSSINRFKLIISEIKKYEKLRLIGYLTTPAIIGFFILRRVNPKLDLLYKTKEGLVLDLENSITEEFDRIKNSYNNIVTRDIYMLHSDKQAIMEHIDSFINGLEFIDTQRELLPGRIIWLASKNFRKANELKGEVNDYNQEFVKSKKKEYSNLFKRENLVLDDEQQTAVIADDKHNLVVAGAGSGKTEILITRIAYLVKRRSDTIQPERILALTFQNKAAEEIKKRLEARYAISSVVPNKIGRMESSKGRITIGTFHALGKKIIHDYYGEKEPQLKKECMAEKDYAGFIQNLLDKEALKDENFQNKIVAFTKDFGYDEASKKESDFEKKEDYYNYQRNLTHTALDGTKVKSEPEKQILNFFMMNNLDGHRIRIIYENPAPWMKYLDESGKECTPKPDFYFPDFDIYLEHWAIDKKGKVPDWFSGKDPTNEYIQHMNLKKRKYEENNKVLIETTQAEFDKFLFDKRLELKFLEALIKKYPDKKFEFTKLSYTELVERVWEFKEFVKMIAVNISRYIVIAKTYNLSPSELEERLREEKWNLKQRAFAEIAITVFRSYENELKKENAIDFSDMINLAIKLLRKDKLFYEGAYKHILIDEYQDISTQRYELIRELMNKNPDCKLFCVGDDWQSIMGFTGSNLNFFVKFDEWFKNPNRTDLTKNYRSIKSIVDAGACIMRNNVGQIKKKTLSNTDKTKPIRIYSSLHKKDYPTKYSEQIAKHALDEIKKFVEMGYRYDDFMILLRIAQRPKLRNFIEEYASHLKIPMSEDSNKPNCVHIMSVHKSKGLQARVVILLNVDQDLYGFPCEIDNPDIFETAIRSNDGLREQEERRLFYVAVTRAKEEVIMYTQKCSESKFISEIDTDLVKRKDLHY